MNTVHSNVFFHHFRIIRGNLSEIELNAWFIVIVGDLARMFVTAFFNQLA